MGDHGCHACGVPFGAYLDRNYLGLPEVRPLPWEAPTGDDEHRAEPASARMMDFRRAAEPLGISSFASDEEIRSGGIGSQGLGQPIHVAPTYHPTLIGSLSATAAGTTLQTAETRTGSLESLPASIAARAAQRKLDDQKKTIRLLIVGILLLGLAVIWLFYTSIVPSTSGTNSEGTSQPPPSAKTASPNAGTSIAQPATSPESAGVSPPATQPTTLPVNLEDVLARAQQQIAVGEQTDRDLPARIAAYEQALSILNEVDPQTLPDPQRSDLAEGIKAVERALNDLRLKSYFP